MSDNSAARSRSTNIEVSANRYANSRSKSRDKRNASDLSSNESICDVEELRQDIINLIQLANQISDKISRTQMNVTASFSADDEMQSTVKCITESFQSISLFIKEDNININDLPEFSELSLKISRLQGLVKVNQIADNKDLRYIPINQNTIKLEVANSNYVQEQAGTKRAVSKSKRSGSSNNFIENDMSIRNMVMNEDYLEDHDLIMHMNLREPLIDKNEDYNVCFNRQTQFLQPYSQNTQKHNREPCKSHPGQFSKIETIGISIFLTLLILLVILYIVS